LCRLSSLNMSKTFWMWSIDLVAWLVLLAMTLLQLVRNEQGLVAQVAELQQEEVQAPREGSRRTAGQGRRGKANEGQQSRQLLSLSALVNYRCTLLACAPAAHLLLAVQKLYNCLP